MDGKLFIEDGVVFILVDILVLLRFYGVGFLWDICIVFIMIVGNFKVKCEVDWIKFILFKKDNLKEYKGEVEINLLVISDE